MDYMAIVSGFDKYYFYRVDLRRQQISEKIWAPQVLQLDPLKDLGRGWKTPGLEAIHLGLPFFAERLFALVIFTFDPEAVHRWSRNCCRIPHHHVLSGTKYRVNSSNKPHSPIFPILMGHD